MEHLPENGPGEPEAVAVTPGEEQAILARVTEDDLRALVVARHVRALRARHGAGTLVGWRNDWTVVYRHEDEAAAQAYARANVELFGHQVSVERDHLGWLLAIDMSRAVAAGISNSRHVFDGDQS